MEPESDEIRVDRMRIIVVLPAPFGPSRARIVPSSAVRLTLSSTRWLPNDLHTSLATIPGVLVWPVIVFCPLYGDPVARGAGRRHAAPPAAPSTPSPSLEDAPLGNWRTRSAPTRSLAPSPGCPHSFLTVPCSDAIDGVGQPLPHTGGDVATLRVVLDERLDELRWVLPDDLADRGSVRRGPFEQVCKVFEHRRSAVAVGRHEVHQIPLNRFDRRAVVLGKPTRARLVRPPALLVADHL